MNIYLNSSLKEKNTFSETYKRYSFKLFSIAYSKKPKNLFKNISENQWSIPIILVSGANWET
jgi:hypothetical protein